MLALQKTLDRLAKKPKKVNGLDKPLELWQLSPMAYFVGIDPGSTGGIGILDRRGQFVAAHRWDRRAPSRLYQLLLTIRGEIEGYLYLEEANAHPGEGLGFVVRNNALMVNWGIWQGFLIAAGVPFALVHPATWQTACGLRNWQAAQKINPALPSPLGLARQLWPAAALECLADDGKAVALLLADLARRDALAGIDRAALSLARQVRTKARRKKLRDQKRGAAPLEDGCPWPPAPAHLVRPDMAQANPLPSTLSPRHGQLVKPFYAPTAQKGEF